MSPAAGSESKMDQEADRCAAQGNQKAFLYQQIADAHVYGVLYLQLRRRILIGNSRFYDPIINTCEQEDNSGCDNRVDRLPKVCPALFFFIFHSLQYPRVTLRL